MGNVCKTSLVPIITYTITTINVYISYFRETEKSKVLCFEDFPMVENWMNWSVDSADSFHKCKKQANKHYMYMHINLQSQKIQHPLTNRIKNNNNIQHSDIK